MGAAIDAPGLSAAIAYWNTMAGRTIFVLGDASSQITVHAAEGVCNAPSVACSAPASVYDHVWHPDMNYPYESCAVYVLADYVSNSWTIAHELGHCLGFDHVTDRPSIMTSPPNPDPQHDRILLVSAGYVQ